mgnify:CR=1 FL=1
MIKQIPLLLIAVGIAVLLLGINLVTMYEISFFTGIVVFFGIAMLVAGADLKRKILSKSLYGVDIEQTAIEICRLRAWLSIIVDINEAEIIEPLPNLDFKFACANTLISLEDETLMIAFTHQEMIFDCDVDENGEMFLGWAVN